jgi:site-specific recombinase
MDFDVIREFIVHNGHAGTDEFAKARQKWLQNINVVSRFAQTLCGKSKGEIIRIVRAALKTSPDHPEITQAEEFYAMLEEGHKDAQWLARMIYAAQIRHLVAMSCVAAEMNSEKAVRERSGNG